MSSYTNQLRDQLQGLPNYPQVKAAHAKVQYHVKRLDQHLDQYPALHTIEQSTGVPKAWGCIGVAVLSTICIWFNFYGNLFCNVLGFGVPAYLSLRALQTPSKDDDIQWYVDNPPVRLRLPFPLRVLTGDVWLTHG